MVVYAVYLTYKSEKLRRTIKTLSDLHITAANSLVTLGSSVKRKTMDRINNQKRAEDGESLVNDIDDS